jgi:hypothetical protein
VATQDLWDELIIGLQVEDPAAIEGALRYLEADPWEFRSGYLKGRLLRHLANRQLDDHQRRRLRPVLLRYCDIGARFEFPEACRLARRIPIPGLRASLIQGLYGGIVAADVRCLRMLFAMKHPRLSERDRVQARRVMLSWAGQVQSRGWDARWVAPTTKRLWPIDPVGHLTAIAGSDNETERDGARLLLRAVRRAERQSSRHGNSAMPSQSPPPTPG